MLFQLYNHPMDFSNCTYELYSSSIICMLGNWWLKAKYLLGMGLRLHSTLAFKMIWEALNGETVAHSCC